MMRITRRLAALAAALALLVAQPLPAQAPATLEEARLAVEEADLRARIVTALAVAESIRLRGRTVLVAMSEIGRVRRRVEQLDVQSENRAEFENRLTKLESRRAELDAELDAEFESYLELVSELASALWSRIDRVGGAVEQDLASRRIERLRELAPVVHGHIEEFNRLKSVTRAVTERWRREIDDTYDMRQERLRAAPPPEPSLTNPNGKPKKEDI